MDTTYGGDDLVIPLIRQVPSVGHAQLYPAVGARAAAIHKTFVNTLSTSSGSYAVTEAANAAATG